MKGLSKANLFIAFFFFISQFIVSAAVIADTSVIVHPDNKVVLSVKDLQRIFQGKMKEFSTGKEVKPINQPFGAKARTEFLEKILNKDEKQERIYWSIELFTGKGIPPREESNELIIKKSVAESQEAIAYINSSLVDSTVRVVYTF